MGITDHQKHHEHRQRRVRAWCSITKTGIVFTIFADALFPPFAPCLLTYSTIHDSIGRNAKKRQLKKIVRIRSFQG